MTAPPGARGLVRPDGSVLVPPGIAEELLRVLVVGLTERVRADGGEVSSSARRILWALHHAAQQTGSAPGTTDPGPGSVELTAAQAAQAIGCTPEYMRRLARTGRITARRAGRAWLVNPQSLDAYRTGSRPP